MTKEWRPRWRRVLPPLVLFLLTTLITGHFARLDVDPYHDGAIFKPALDVARGQVLFRETFTQYGALYVWLEAAALAVFGEHVVVIRLLAAVFYGFVAVGLWLAWSRIVPRWMATVACLAWIGVGGYWDRFFLAWSSVHALACQAFSAVFLFRATLDEDRRRVDLALAGGFAGLAFWFRQPGGLVLVAWCVYLVSGPRPADWADLRSRLRQVAVLLAGFAGVLLAGVLPIALGRSFADWIKQSFVFAGHFGRTFARLEDPLHVLSHLFPFGDLGYYQTGSLLYGLLPTLNLAAGAWAFTRMMGRTAPAREERALYALCGFGAVSWPQYLPFPDSPYHAFWAAAPMIGVAAFVAWRLAERSVSVAGGGQVRWLAPAFALVSMALLFGRDIHERLGGALVRVRETYTTVEEPSVLRGLRLKPAEARHMQQVHSFLERHLSRHPEAPVITVHRSALFMTFARTQANFHPLYVDWRPFMPWLEGPDLYPEYTSALLAYVQRKQPLVISGGGIVLPGYVEIPSAYPYEPLHFLVPAEPPAAR